jgi:hypothetical protein
MVTGRAGPGPIRAQHVISIFAIGHGRQTIRTGHFIVYAGKQLVFAVKAAIRAIGPVGRVVPLPGLDLDDAGADDRGDLMCRHTLIRRQTGRDAEDGDNLVGAKCPHGQGEQDRGVDATGERDAQRGRPQEPRAHRLGGRRELTGETLIRQTGHIGHLNCLVDSYHCVIVAVYG